MPSDAGDTSLEDLRGSNDCNAAVGLPLRRLLLLECALPAAHILISRQDVHMALLVSEEKAKASPDSYDATPL
eukprot:12938104-Prorocentrum_lima.AAC.1